MTVLPISNKGDGYDLQKSLSYLFVRCAKLARKRPSPLGMKIPVTSMELTIIFDELYNGKMSAEEACKQINELMEA